jgi:hypothetical protein
MMTVPKAVPVLTIEMFTGNRFAANMVNVEAAILQLELSIFLKGAQIEGAFPNLELTLL